MKDEKDQKKSSYFESKAEALLFLYLLLVALIMLIANAKDTIRIIQRFLGS